MIKNVEGEGWLGSFYFTQIGDDNKWELSFEGFSAGTVALNEYGMLAIDFTKATRWETNDCDDPPQFPGLFLSAHSYPA